MVTIYRKRFPYLGIAMLWVVAVLLAATATWWFGGLGLGSVPGLYAVPAGSMRPGLAPGDYVLVSKDHYADSEPERGDIVIFKLPRDNRTDDLKRLVGLPGERVQIAAGVLQIDGTPVGRDKLGLRRVPGFGGRSEPIWYPYTRRKLDRIRRLMRVVWGSSLGRFLS